MEDGREKMTGLQSDPDTGAESADAMQNAEAAESTDAAQNAETAENTDAAQNAETAESAPQREMSIEETLQELENLIEKMEDRSSSLEETFACYERGMKLVKECSGKIDRVEKKLMILTEDGQNDEF